MRSLGIEQLRGRGSDAGEGVGLTAVIQGFDGSAVYWALRHSSDRPDFHHGGSFAAEL